VLEKKLEIIAEIKKDKSVRSVSELFSIPKSTVQDVWREKEFKPMLAIECSFLVKKGVL